MRDPNKRVGESIHTFARWMLILLLLVVIAGALAFFVGLMSETTAAQDDIAFDVDTQQTGDEFNLEEMSLNIYGIYTVESGGETFIEDEELIYQTETTATVSMSEWNEALGDLDDPNLIRFTLDDEQGEEFDIDGTYYQYDLPIEETLTISYDDETVDEADIIVGGDADESSGSWLGFGILVFLAIPWILIALVSVALIRRRGGFR